mgnify:CR=1 FL=1
MSVYLLAEVEKIHDEKSYNEYIEKARPIVTRYGGKYIVTSDKLSPMSPSWTAQKVVLIEFENKQRMQECFQSAEYGEIVHLRTGSIESKAVIIE